MSTEAANVFELTSYTKTASSPITRVIFSPKIIEILHKILHIKGSQHANRMRERYVGGQSIGGVIHPHRLNGLGGDALFGLSWKIMVGNWET